MLIECPECKGQVSGAAKSCPHCGFPLKPTLLGSAKGFLSAGKNVFGLALCLVGFILPSFLLSVAKGADAILLLAIATVHLLPLGLVVLVGRWKRSLIVIMLVLSLGSAALGMYCGILNAMKDPQPDWWVFMFIWAFFALVDTIFFGVKFRVLMASSPSVEDRFVSQSFACLGKTILTIVASCILACGCGEVYGFLFSLFTPEHHLTKSVFLESLMMRQLRSMGCMMIVFPFMFCLPLVKMASWAWGRMAGSIVRALFMLLIVFMMLSHIVKSLGRLKEYVGGNDWTILVCMALSSLGFFYLSRKKGERACR